MLRAVLDACVLIPAALRDILLEDDRDVSVLDRETVRAEPRLLNVEDRILRQKFDALWTEGKAQHRELLLGLEAVALAALAAGLMNLMLVQKAVARDRVQKGRGNHHDHLGVVAEDFLAGGRSSREVALAMDPVHEEPRQRAGVQRPDLAGGDVEAVTELRRAGRNAEKERQQ